MQFIKNNVHKIRSFSEAYRPSLCERDNKCVWPKTDLVNCMKYFKFSIFFNEQLRKNFRCLRELKSAFIIKLSGPYRPSDNAGVVFLRFWTIFRIKNENWSLQWLFICETSIFKIILCAVYVDDLANLCTFSRGLRIVLYADDILLLAPSISALESLLNLCER